MQVFRHLQIALDCWSKQKSYEKQCATKSCCQFWSSNWRCEFSMRLPTQKKNSMVLHSAVSILRMLSRNYTDKHSMFPFRASDVQSESCQAICCQVFVVDGEELTFGTVPMPYHLCNTEAESTTILDWDTPPGVSVSFIEEDETCVDINVSSCLVHLLFIPMSYIGHVLFGGLYSTWF